MIANDFRETISVLKRKHFYTEVRLSLLKKKNLKIDSGLPYLKKVSAAEIASRKSIAINFKTSSINDSQIFFLGKKVSKIN